jgi:hypothetical protein
VEDLASKAGEKEAVLILGSMGAREESPRARRHGIDVFGATRRFEIERRHWLQGWDGLRRAVAYMHNGAFSDLRDVVAFYATRDLTPRRWYKSAVAFDDVPAKYRAQVGIERVPYDRHAGQPPRLNDTEIDAVVAFLKTD